MTLPRLCLLTSLSFPYDDISPSFYDTSRLFNYDCRYLEFSSVFTLSSLNNLKLTCIHIYITN